MLTTFLSHASADRPLVEAVAVALGRRGIVAWLDKNELFPGQSLTRGIREGIRAQTSVTLFLSETALTRPWVRDELEEALDLDAGRPDWIVPVYLGDALALVRSHRRLCDEWLHPNGDRVDRLGIAVPGYDPARGASEAAGIADKIAARLYGMAKLQQAREVNVVLDQRGAGRRSGDFSLPKKIVDQQCRTLVFRPDTGARTASETLDGPDFEAFARDITAALGPALGPLRAERTIRVFGDAQLALYFLLGRYFDRTTGAALYLYNAQTGLAFDNAGQSRISPLAGGNAHCETTASTLPGAPPAIATGTRAKTLALYVGGRNYLPQVQAHVAAAAAATGAPPLVFVETGRFADSNEVMRMVADVVALLARLRDDQGTQWIAFYTGLPGAAVALLAANLTHVAENVEFMEFRRDYAAENVPAAARYVALRMP